MLSDSTARLFQNRIPSTRTSISHELPLPRGWAARTKEISLVAGRALSKDCKIRHEVLRVGFKYFGVFFSGWICRYGNPLLCKRHQPSDQCKKFHGILYTWKKKHNWRHWKILTNRNTGTAQVPRPTPAVWECGVLTQKLFVMCKRNWGGCKSPGAWFTRR